MKKRWIIIPITLLLLMAVSAVLASTGGDFELSWFTFDGGGGTSNGGDFSLSGTIGQPDAGSMSQGDYTLNGGFWIPEVEPTVEPTPTIEPTVEPSSFEIYLPLTIK